MVQSCVYGSDGADAGLSIGANSAIFSVVDSVLLKSLPYPEPERIVRVFLSGREFPRFSLNPFDFRDYRQHSKSFESMAAYVRADAQLLDGGEAVRLNGFGITAGYFRVLGLKPELGREFDETAEIPGSGSQVILSDRLWRTRFAGSEQIVGKKVTLDMQPYTVVGVMPPGTQHPGNEYHALAYGESVDVWRPFTFEGNPAHRGSHFLDGIGRLKPGITAEQAQAELNSVMAQMAKEHPADEGWQMLVVPLYVEIVGTSRRMLLVLLGTVGDGPADCVCQCSEPITVASVGKTPGGCSTIGTGRIARPPDSTTADGKPANFPPGRWPGIGNPL